MYRSYCQTIAMELGSPGLVINGRLLLSQPLRHKLLHKRRQTTKTTALCAALSIVSHVSPFVTPSHSIRGGESP